MRLRVVCGLLETIAIFSPTRKLVKVDLPTLGRPAIVIIAVFVAVKIKERFGMGEWIVIVAVVVGVLSSVCSFITFAKQMIAQAKAESQEEETEDET